MRLILGLNMAIFGLLLTSCVSGEYGEDGVTADRLVEDTVTSTQYNVSFNTGYDVVLEYSVNQYIEDRQKIEEQYLRQYYAGDEETIQEELDSYREHLSSKSIESIEKNLIHNQMEFLLQDWHYDRSSMENFGLVREELADGYTRVKYNVGFRKLAEKGEDTPGLEETAARIPARIHLSSLAALYTDEPDCFDKEAVEENRIHSPIDWANHIFYYFRSESCTFSSPVWKHYVFDSQTVNTNELKYPEYHKIWEDGMFEATMIFTPANKFEKDDEGVRGYQNAIEDIVSLMRTLYRLQPSGVYFPALADALANPVSTLSYTLPSGSQIVFNFLLWGEYWRNNWNEDDDNIYEEQFRNHSRRADYISYNGHAGYGGNVRQLEEWTEVAQGKYQIFYVDGCSTFSYLEDIMFTKRQYTNPGSTPGQFLDLISNVQPSYFGMMAKQNSMIIKGLLRKYSYYDICRSFDSHFASWRKKFDPSVIVSGEEDNIYNP